MIAYYYHFHPEQFVNFTRRGRRPILLVSTVLLLSAVVVERTTFFMHTVGLSALYVGFGGVLALSITPKTADAGEPPSSGLHKLPAGVGRGLAFVGYYSYAIYLWHAPVASGGMRLIRRATGDMHTVVEFFLYVIASVAIGFAMTKLVDAPMLRLRDRIWPARGTTV
jgi:peptidoglycan/LPS O-acetylase OafA/YrhL